MKIDAGLGVTTAYFCKDRNKVSESCQSMLDGHLAL